MKREPNWKSYVSSENFGGPLRRNIGNVSQFPSGCSWSSRIIFHKEHCGNITEIEEQCLGTNDLEKNYHKQLKFVSFINRLVIRLIRREGVWRCLHEG